MTEFSRSDIFDLGTRLGLGSVAAELAALAEPAARMEIDPAPQRPATGSSKLGGLPDLPAETLWPVLNDRPAVFVAQVSLEEAPFLSVPSGTERPLLSLFLSRDPATEEIDDAIVIPVSPHHRLRPRPHPVPAEKAELLDVHQITLRPELTLPPWTAGSRSPLESLDIPTPDRPRYIVLLEQLDAAQGLQGPRHRLLGHPREIEDDVLVEAALMSFWQQRKSYDEAQLLSEARNWRQLAQFDRDPRLMLPYERAGTIHFCVPARGRRAIYERANAFARTPGYEHGNPGSNGDLGSIGRSNPRKAAGRAARGG